jgi:hypothetical protein
MSLAVGWSLRKKQQKWTIKMTKPHIDCTSVESLPRRVIAGYVVFNAFGRPQFAWKDRRNGYFYAESDGRRLGDVILATKWFSDVMH